MPGVDRLIRLYADRCWIVKVEVARPQRIHNTVYVCFSKRASHWDERSLVFRSLGKRGGLTIRATRLFAGVSGMASRFEPSASLLALGR